MRSTDKQDAESEENNETEVDITQIEAWYTPQIPVGHGPSEYWVARFNFGGWRWRNNNVMFKIVINPVEAIEIEAPKKGTTVTKNEYQDIIQNKMAEFRNNKIRRR